MKVKCINTGAIDLVELLPDELKLNSEYEVISENDNDYYIINEFGSTVGYFKSRFKIIEETYDFINPQHYKQGDKETWEKMVDIWGKEAFIKHCEITAFKYIQRLGAKPNNSIDNDLEKARWYLNKAYELKQQ